MKNNLQKISEISILFAVILTIPDMLLKPERIFMSENFPILREKWSDNSLIHSTIIVKLQLTTLHYNSLHYITVQYITLQSTKLHYTLLYYITVHYITLQSSRYN